MAAASPNGTTGMDRGWFVCLEGIDGAGKTTAVEGAGELLRGRGVPVVSFDKKDVDAGSPYVRQHLVALREVIWEHPPDAPYLELGDFHWVYLQAAWYAALAHGRVEPMLAAGRVVLTDTWAFKFLAKLRLRPGVDFERARAAFAGLVQPDLVIRLDVDPAIAAARRSTFSISETGNRKGPVELSAQAFEHYQRRLARVLAEFGRSHGWMTVQASRMTVAEVVHRVADLVQNQIATSEGRTP